MRQQAEQRTSTQFGIETDDKDRQPLNRFSSGRQSCDGVSNVTSRSPLQQEQQFEQSRSTQFGIQIERNDEHPRNADDPIRQTLDPRPNTISVIDSHPEKQKADNAKPSFGIPARESQPKYRTNERSLHRIKKERQTENPIDVDSTRASRKPFPPNVGTAILSADAGVRMDSSEEQCEKVPDSIPTTFEGGSNSIDRIHRHPANASGQIP
jgi:hypothetical protein